MPYRLKIQFSQARLLDIVKGLKKAHEPEVLDSVDLTPYANKGLAYLKSIFPDSRESGILGSEREFGKGFHLVSGWRTSRIVGAVTRGFEFTHTRAGNSRVATILRTLDTGHKAYSYIAQKDFSFIDPTARGRGGKLKWVSVAEGETISHGRDEGERYSSRTLDYIQQTMLPAMHNKIVKRIRKVVTND